jgi:hypothetical protein
VLPGIPPDARATAALNRLKGIPIAAFAGGEDSQWAQASEDTKEKLDHLGIENTLQIVPGQGHVIQLDPAMLFNLLDSRRPNPSPSNATAPSKDAPQPEPEPERTTPALE